jgi:CARDB/Lectin C-type domain
MSVVAGPIRNPATGHDYYLLSPSNWTASEAEAQTLGGHLVTINDAAENAWVTTRFQSFGLTTQVWTGLNRTAYSQFEWTSGAPVTYLNWAPGEPNNATGAEFYGDFYSLDTIWGAEGQWNDAPDGFINSAVVEVDPQANHRPDLTGVYFSVPATATAGRTASASISVNNVGASAASGQIGIGYYLSRDETLDSGDTRVALLPLQINLAPGQGVPFRADIPIPGSTPAGVYHLIVKVDDGNAIDEGINEGNNIAVDTPLTVRRLSGAEWVGAFPASTSVADLDPGFAASTSRFIQSLESGGATVNVLATLLPQERAYLMHWSWLIAERNYPANRVPPMDGVDIDWWHGNQAHSRAAARAMVHGFGICGLGAAPALESNQTRGLALDMAVTWTGNLTVVDGNGVSRTIRGGPRNSANRALISVGATFGVIHYRPICSDKNHWTVNGR